MKTKFPSREAGSPRIRLPIVTTAILLGIYVGAYLAVAGVVHVLSSPDATAAVARDISMSAALTDASARPVPPRNESVGQASERIDSSRGCRLTETIDTRCIFN